MVCTPNCDEMVFKEETTTPLLRFSEKKHDSMVSFLSPLESIYHNTRLPDMKGDILVKKLSWVAFLAIAEF